MEQIVLLAVQAVEALLPAIEGASSGELAKIIALLEQAVPFAAKLGEDLITPIENIITELEGSGNVTPEQVTQLAAQSDALDAALDAAAKDDGLAGA